MLNKFLQTSALTFSLVGLGVAGSPDSAKADFVIGIPEEFSKDENYVMVYIRMEIKPKDGDVVVQQSWTKPQLAQKTVTLKQSDWAPSSPSNGHLDRSYVSL